MRKAIDEAGADGVNDIHEHHRQSARRLLQRHHGRGTGGQDDIWGERDQFCCGSATAVGIHRAPTVVDSHAATDGPAQLLQPLSERGDAGRCFWIVGGQVHKDADAPHALALLRPRRERPGGRRAAEQRDENAAFHSITWSAVICMISGTVRPSALAVLKLITSSYLVGDCTGKSAGLSPLRMRSTYEAERRTISMLSGP